MKTVFLYIPVRTLMFLSPTFLNTRLLRIKLLLNVSDEIIEEVSTIYLCATKNKFKTW